MGDFKIHVELVYEIISHVFNHVTLGLWLKIDGKLTLLDVVSGEDQYIDEMYFE